MEDKNCNTCSECKFYESYRNAYCDEMEPDEQGFCKGNPEKDYHTHSESEACEYFKSINN